MPICDKCQAHIPDGAQFCPQCADPVTAADHETAPVESPNASTIAIRFGHSTSGNYDDAVHMAMKLPTYRKVGEGKDVEHHVSLGTEDVGLAISLWDVVGGWSSSQMTIDGARASKKDLTRGALGCYQARQEAFNPQQYCFGEGRRRPNIWGCQRMNMPLSGWANWLQWGDFDDHGRWVFDKERIRHALERQLYENRFCPVLNRERVLKTLGAMPGRVDPKRDLGWEYITKWAEGKGRVAVGVRPLIDHGPEYVIGDYTPTWEAQDPETITTTVAVGAEQAERKRQSNTNGCTAALAWIAVAAIVFFMSCAVLVSIA